MVLSGYSISIIHLGSLLRASHGPNHDGSRTPFLSGGPVEETTARLSQVVGRVPCCFKTEVLFPCCAAKTPCNSWSLPLVFAHGSSSSDPAIMPCMLLVLGISLTASALSG